MWGVAVAACLQLAAAATLLLGKVLGEAKCWREGVKSCSFHMFSWPHQATFVLYILFQTAVDNRRVLSRNNPPEFIKKHKSSGFSSKNYGFLASKHGSLPRKRCSKDEMDLDCQQHFCDRRVMVWIVSWPKRPSSWLMDTCDTCDIGETGWIWIQKMPRCRKKGWLVPEYAFFWSHGHIFESLQK